MALNRIVVMLYIIDILYYTIFNDNWGIGVGNRKKMDLQLLKFLWIVRFFVLN